MGEAWREGRTLRTRQAPMWASGEGLCESTLPATAQIRACWREPQDAWLAMGKPEPNTQAVGSTEAILSHFRQDCPPTHTSFWMVFPQPERDKGLKTHPSSCLWCCLSLAATSCRTLLTLPWYTCGR